MLRVMEAVALVMQRFCLEFASNYVSETNPTPTPPLSPRMAASEACGGLDSATIMRRNSLDFCVRSRCIPDTSAVTT